MFSRFLLIVACVFGCSGVGLGAFFAHGYESWKSDAGLEASVVAKGLANGNTAVKYHLLHAIAILALMNSTTTRNSVLHLMSASFFLVGICLFSGGLYSIVLFDFLGHWAIVPCGGLVLMVGWLFAAIGFSICQFPMVRKSND